jgi:hypothetical protein
MNRSVIMFLVLSSVYLSAGIAELILQSSVNLYYLVLSWKQADSLYFLGTGIALYAALEARSQ